MYDFVLGKYFFGKCLLLLALFCLLVSYIRFSDDIY